MVDDILKELAQKRRALHEEFRSIETQEDIYRLEKGWEEYHQQVEALKDIPKIDDTLEEDKIKLNIMLGKCQTQEDFMELREWWDDRHPHIIPNYDISEEEFKRRFGFVSLEEIWEKHFGDTPMPGRDYAVLPSPDEHEEYEEEVSREQEDEDKEQAEFIGQCRRELEARVIELRNNQQ
jgi:hypothetical protein